MSDLDNEELEATRNLKVNGSDIDEDINEIEKIKYLFKFLKDHGWIPDINKTINIDKTIKAIERIIQEYTKQKQKNEELRKKIKGLKEQLEYDKTHIFTPITINLNYIPKQKIKYKINENSNMIREIEEKIIKEEKSGDICEEYLSDLYKEKSLIERDIVTLRELLQESEDK